jgi:uncharacterized protein DUF669
MSDLTNILPGGFDATAVEPQEARTNEPLPAGAYDVEITGSEVKDAKSGNGTGLKLEYTVLGPTHARRKIFQYINLRHTSAQAEQIGQSQLSALCRALGIPKLTDSDQLFQRTLRVTVKVRPSRDGFDASNDVTAYEALGTAPPPASRQAPAPTAAAKPAGGSLPWQKKAA